MAGPMSGKHRLGKWIGLATTSKPDGKTAPSQKWPVFGVLTWQRAISFGLRNLRALRELSPSPSL